MPANQRIQLLDPLVAQRIAAGEVIDRPQAIVRELIDNAVDAGARHIDVHIEQGGIESIRVIDDGSGMEKEDLALSCRSHATSKVKTVHDLSHVATLGFRGEALASIAVCSRLTVSSRDSAGQTHTLTVSDGQIGDPVRSGHAKGTTVTAEKLFHAIPGRKKFLKSPQAESAACRRTFVEKALAFPDIEFRYYSGGQLNLFLPAADRVSRIIDAHPKKFDPVFFDLVTETAGSFSIEAVCSTPSFYRGDRSFIQIFINNRRIDDYALLQAVVYGYSDYLPGGCFPHCFVFLTVDPELVDVNIHPAKREVKLRNGKEIHQQLVGTIKAHLSAKSRSRIVPEHHNQQDLSFPQPQRAPASYPHQSSGGGSAVQEPRAAKADEKWLSQAKQLFNEPEAQSEPGTGNEDFRYFGQLFGLFLLAERAGRFYFIDQHAAHERIIFDRLSTDPGRQELLVPVSFEVSEELEAFLRSHADHYRSAGITLSPAEEGRLQWEIRSLPAYARYIEEEIVSFIKEHTGDAQDLARELFASIACRSAVMDGDALDAVTARQLVAQTFDLPVPRCPHGRPVWREVTRDELFASVQRTF